MQWSVRYIPYVCWPGAVCRNHLAVPARSTWRLYIASGLAPWPLGSLAPWLLGSLAPWLLGSFPWLLEASASSSSWRVPCDSNLEIRLWNINYQSASWSCDCEFLPPASALWILTSSFSTVNSCLQLQHHAVAPLEAEICPLPLLGPGCTGLPPHLQLQLQPQLLVELSDFGEFGEVRKFGYLAGGGSALCA